MIRGNTVANDSDYSHDNDDYNFLLWAHDADGGSDSDGRMMLMSKIIVFIYLINCTTRSLYASPRNTAFPCESEC